MSSAARALIVPALLSEAVLLGVITNPAHPLSGRWVLPWEAGAGVAFAVAVLSLRGLQLSWRAGLALVLGVAALLDIIGLLSAPTSSDDDFRYAWDAKVQLHGIDPYRYTPSDPVLAPLRDSFDFGPTAGCPGGREVPLGACSLINRPYVHTIYPPVAQAAFVLTRLVSFGRGGHLPLQVAAALAGLAVSLLLARRVRSGQAEWWSVALWAWCPITVLELANDAHIEGLAVLLSVAAVLASEGGRDRAAGLWAGAAIAVKLYPALLLPALMRRRPVLVAGSAVGLVALSYVPHVAVVGRAVVGYLPGYLNEEDYSSGGRFLLLGLLVPARAAEAVALVALAAVGWFIWRRRRSDDPVTGALWMVGAFFLIATPGLSWYPLLLLALCALAARPEWLGVVAAPTVIYLGAKFGWDQVWTGRSAYVVGALLVLTITIGRKGYYRRRWNRTATGSASESIH